MLVLIMFALAVIYAAAIAACLAHPWIAAGFGVVLMFVVWAIVRRYRSEPERD